MTIIISGRKFVSSINVSELLIFNCLLLCVKVCSNQWRNISGGHR